ncbi:PotD/PotF family extracellular solute-binding protein [Aestuariivirga sp.]|uniref:ABC transporter substrate-binding protein n=1 Tax=Aestuariivirga sp. TaxID=2650926 RepID=UPI003918A926
MTSSTHPRTSVIRIRRYLELDRRQLLKGALSVGALGVVSPLHKAAYAATNLNYIGWEGYNTFLEAGDFPKSKGAELQKTFISSADEVITKLRLGSGQVDICTPYFIHDDFLAREGLLEPLDLNKIPNFQKLHPTIVEYTKNNMSEGDIWYSVPMTYGSICMVYNADKIPEPTSWTDMLKEEYQGKVAITSDYPGNLFAWARVAGVEHPNRMTRDELKKVVELLVTLKKNHLRTIAPSYGDLINLLASGEVVVAQGWEPVTVWAGDKVKIKVAYPKEKSMGFIEGYAIGKGSANIDLAHEIINHALSLEGQLAGAEANTMPVVTSEAMEQASEGNKALYNYGNLDDYFTQRTMVVPMYPLEEDGDLATWDEYQAAWETVIKS